MDEFHIKVLKLAAEICWMHGSNAGDRVCQDWSGSMDILNSLSPEEKDTLYLQYQQYNSDGKEFKSGEFPYDEMMISFMAARALELMISNKANKSALLLLDVMEKKWK